MRLAVFFSPNRWMKTRSPVRMLRDTPAWTFIRQKIHVQNSTAPTGTYHRCLFLIFVFLNDIKCSRPERSRQSLFDQYRFIWRPEKTVNSRPDATKKTKGTKPYSKKKDLHSPHVFRLSASSISPNSGLVSPKPTFLPRMSQIPSSGS